MLSSLWCSGFRRSDNISTLSFRRSGPARSFGLLPLQSIPKIKMYNKTHMNYKYFNHRSLFLKLRRILRPGLAIRKKFKIRLLFRVEYQGKAGVIVCFEWNSNYYFKIQLYKYLREITNQHSSIRANLKRVNIRHSR